VPGAPDPIEQIVKAYCVAEFLKGEHVGGERADRAGQRIQLVVEVLLCVGTVDAPGREQVLHIPRRHREHGRLLPGVPHRRSRDGATDTLPASRSAAGAPGIRDSGHLLAKEHIQRVASSSADRRSDDRQEDVDAMA
jgi:hypothetical protein